MLKEYENRAAACAKEGDDYATYLLRLCERELLEREQRAAERRLKAAQFPVLKTLDTFDFDAQPSLNRALILDLMRSEYLERWENVLFLGSPRHRQDPPRHGLLAMPPAPRANACASVPSRPWSPNSWRPAKNVNCSGS